VIPTRKRHVVDEYLAHLQMEIRLVASALGERNGVRVLHLGGGTPTFLRPVDLEKLFAVLRTRFRFIEDCEISVELDPRVTTAEHLRTLKALGVNRVSLGVQDIDPAVQEAIGRFQSEEETVRTYQACREAGFRGVNLDLIYGLPGQTGESLAATVDRVIDLKPDRIAIYGFAYVPWMRPNQKAIDPESLPRAPDRLLLFSTACHRFSQAGYLPIGMDHFALPDDELSLAFREGRLGRNFMGYTPHAALDQIGLGISSIGSLAGAYVQNEKKLASYYRLLQSGSLAVERGLRLSHDDLIRRWVIQEILCQFHVDFQAFERQTGLPFELYFRAERPELLALAEGGFLELGAEGLSVTSLGRHFLRNVAMVFDRYNRDRTGAQKFSRTV
jgi:oxygen-independent coproporphyrinogen-3 oxidase